MSDTATKPPKARKPNVGSDPTNGVLVKRWQIGFYAFAIGTCAVMVGVNLVYVLSGHFSLIFAGLAVFVIGLTLGLFTAKNDGFSEPDGIKVGEAEPALVDFVHDVAARMGSAAPDVIYLVTAAEFGITEDTRFFGRVVERSVLTIGLPYLQQSTRQELAVLLAYEFAHYGDHDVEEGVRAQRSLLAARALITKERDGFINGVYGSYARKMYRSVGGVGAAQEAAAERAAVEAYGTETLLSVMAKHDDIAVGFDQMLREYVVPALQHQMHPSDLFGGFGQLMQSSNRAKQRARDVERRRSKARNEFELRLKPAERSARAEAWPTEQGTVELDDANAHAHTLLDPASKSADIVVRMWAAKLMANRTESQTWHQLANDIYSAKAQTVASMIFDADTSAADQLEQAFLWSAADDWTKVDGPIEACLKTMKDPGERRTKWARCVVVEAAAATGGFSWQHSWDGPPLLVDSSGRSLDAAGIAVLLADGKSGEARRSFELATAT